MSFNDFRAGGRRFAPLVAVLIALLMLSLGASACSSEKDGSSSTSGEETAASSERSTTTTGEPVMELMPPKNKVDESGNKDGESGSSGSSGTSSGSNRSLVVGGKTAEEYEQQLPELEAQLEKDPDNVDLLLELAVAQYNTQRFTAAVETYQHILKVDDDPTMRNNYANVLRDWGKSDQAISEYRRALKDDPTLAVAYINLASVLDRGGESEEALKVVDEGIAQVSAEDKTRLESMRKTLIQE